MQLQYTPYLWPYLAAFIVLLAAIAWCWQQRAAKGALALIVTGVAGLVWCAAAAFELASADVPAKLLWAGLAFAGIVCIAPSWLVFILQYTGRTRVLGAGPLLGLAAIPLLALILLWTNEAHGLMRVQAAIGPQGAVGHMVAGNGPAFWLWLLDAAVLLLIAAWLLAGEARRKTSNQRRQVFGLLAAPAICLAAAALAALHVNSLGGLDLTALSLAIATPLVLPALVSAPLLPDATPVRSAAAVGQDDGMLVVDDQGSVVAINAVAAGVLGVGMTTAMGRSLRDLVAGQDDLVHLYEDMVEGETEITSFHYSPARYFRVEVTPHAGDNGQQSGHTIVIHDITANKEAEARLAYFNTHDVLTGLYNRSYFETELARLQRGRGFPVTILVGELAGVEADGALVSPTADDLRRAAMVLKSAFRGEDLVARTGELEFAVILPAVGPAIAQSAAARVRRGLCAQNDSSGEPPLQMMMGAATADIGMALEETLAAARAGIHS